MPALTHGRVKNGFNLFARTVRYAQGNCDNDPESAGDPQPNKNAERDPWGNRVCEGAERALCCGRPLQPFNLSPGYLFQKYRVPTGPCNRKFASTASVGQSFAAKRAIARRVAIQNYNGEHRNCCLLPTVTYSKPRNAYRNPCSGGPTKYTLLTCPSNPSSSN